MQKTLESLTPLEEGSVKEFYHQLYGLRRIYESGAQDTVVMHQKTLLYSSQAMGPVKLTLDHRESYEVSRLGRVYDIEIQGDFVLITFKQQDEKGETEYEQYMGIRGVKNVQVLNEWKEKQYSYDKERKSQSDYWVYEALVFTPKHKVVISSSTNKAEARTLCDISYFHFDDILTTVHLKTREQLPNYHSIYNSKQHSAASLASWSLLQMHQQFQFDHQMITGIYAGYPWFFQLWSRDELISLGGLMDLARQLNDTALYKNIKSILARHIKSILADGTLSNRYPHSDLGSIDAFGWLAKRINDFLIILKEEKKLYDLFEIPELLLWYKLLKEGLVKAKEHHQEEGLFKNGFNETWMDTSYNDEGRTGFRIEIQALHYAIYDAIILLGNIVDSPEVHDYADEQKQFRETIRSRFLINGRVIDGFSQDIDWSYRPNIFLAGFVAFDLFTRNEWKHIAVEYLEQLMTPWGGLSTIEASNALYQPYYTGQTNESYHRGDSWYFVNNIAAMVLHQIDPHIFKEAIQLIAQASATDILDLGLAGHGSEISSAQEQKAQGCLAQAWSVATYLELMSALYPLYD
ncbi:MAG: hypothetical protein KC535_03870 [Nanoarchaeota archaeon]|nr:hypothetical protein [Nanoarchaeota archaeon]